MSHRNEDLLRSATPRSPAGILTGICSTAATASSSTCRVATRCQERTPGRSSCLSLKGRTHVYRTAHIYRIEDGRRAEFREYPEDLYVLDEAWS